MRKKNQNKMQAICSIAGLLFVAFIFAACLSEEEPTPIEQEDLETGRVVWKEAPAAVEENDNITIIFDENGIPLATLSDIVTESTTPTATKAPTPTATKAPTPTAATPKKSGNGYLPGIPGTYLAETNGTHAFKAWTHYKMYNDKSSEQYRLQQIAHDDDHGIRVVTDSAGVDRYCIALGTAWAGGKPADIGRCIDVYMQNGAVLHCVLADVKRVEDTQGGACLYDKINGGLLEFIVNQYKIPGYDVSVIGGAFAGEVIEVWVLDMFIAGFGG